MNGRWKELWDWQNKVFILFLYFPRNVQNMKGVKLCWWGWIKLNIFAVNSCSKDKLVLNCTSTFCTKWILIDLINVNNLINNINTLQAEHELIALDTRYNMNKKIRISSYSYFQKQIICSFSFEYHLHIFHVFVTKLSMLGCCLIFASEDQESWSNVIKEIKVAKSYFMASKGIELNLIQLDYGSL